MPYASDAVGILWFAFWLYWLLSASSAKKSVPQPGYWQYQIAYRLVIICLILLLLRVRELRQFFLQGSLIVPGPAIQLLGICVCVLGLAFAVWARVSIGRNWGVPMSLREEHELVVSGPYRWVRHPIYGGIFVALFGTSLVAGKLWLLVLVISLPYFVYSAVREEHTMTQQFPEDYPEYKKRTKMFVPFIV